MQEYRAPRFGFNTHGDVISLHNCKGRNVTIIAAMDRAGGIGKDNGIPWKVSADMQQFKRLTTGNPVIMGRKTFQSFGGRVLPKRPNVVLTRDYEFVKKMGVDHPSVTMANGLETAISTCNDRQIFIIGGAEIYKRAIELDLVHDMILTRFSNDTGCDTFFPAFDERDWFPPTFSSHPMEGGGSMRYEYWQRRFKEG